MSPRPESWDAVAVRGRLRRFIGLFRALCETVPDEMIDPASISLLADARAAGRRTGVLSNDAYTFVGREFFAGRPEFAELDAFVDASDIGVRKPDAEAYLRAAAALGVQPHESCSSTTRRSASTAPRAVGMAAVLVS